MHLAGEDEVGPIVDQDPATRKNNWGHPVPSSSGADITDACVADFNGPAYGSCNRFL
jgi:hypothetical protein